METPPFEDVFPIQDVDFPSLRLPSWEAKLPWLGYVVKQTMVFLPQAGWQVLLEVACNWTPLNQPGILSGGGDPSSKMGDLKLPISTPLLGCPRELVNG